MKSTLRVWFAIMNMNTLKTYALLLALLLLAIVLDSPAKLRAQHTPSALLIKDIRKHWGEPGAQLALLGQSMHSVDSSTNFDSTHSTKKEKLSNIPSAPTLFGDYWLYVSQSDQDGHWEIYGKSAFGGGVTRLTFGQATNHDANLSVDTTKIVFVSERDGNSEIYRMNSDGSAQTRLTFHVELDTQPIWSPDGSRIAFLSRRDGNAELYSMNAVGSDLRRLTVAAQIDLYPSWSPDGRQIAWLRIVDNWFGKIWVMNADGTNPQPITGPLLYVQHPVWSPDGSRIAFDYDADEDGFNEIAVMNSNGSNIQTVMDGGGYPLSSVEELWMSNWLPGSVGIGISTFEFVLPGVTPPYYFNGRSHARTVCFVNERCAGFEIGVYPSPIPINYLLPSVQNQDPFPPTSQMHKLPVWLRANDLWLAWSAVDRGPSDVNNFDLQFRSDQDPTWRRFRFGSLYSEFVRETDIGEFWPDGYDATQGNLYFRVRARDQADNEEAWSESGVSHTSTTLYKSTIKGRLSDLRGNPKRQHPIPISPAPLDPPRTDANGEFVAHLADSAIHTVTYTTNHHRTLDSSSDQRVVMYVSPVNNLLRNGNFASGLSDWNTPSPSYASVISSALDGGNPLLRLGLPCLPECWLRQQLTATLASAPISVTLRDKMGTIHLLAISEPGIGSVLYQQLPAQGEWSQPTTLINAASNHISALLLKNGQLHVVASANGTTYRLLPGAIHYVVGDSNGSWSSPILAAIGAYPQLSSDDHGTLNLVYSLCTYACNAPRKVLLRSRSSTSDWSAEVQLTEQLYEDFASATLDDGSVHLLWQRRFADNHSYSSHVMHTLRRTDGQLVSQPLIDGKYGSLLQLVAAPDQTLHAIWYYDNNYHAQFSMQNGWSEAQLVVGAVQPTEVAANVKIDASSTVHLYSEPSLNGGTFSSVFRFKPANQPWSSPLLADMLSTPGESVTHTRPLTLTISQTVTLPAQMHKPTLSFLYQLLGNGDTGDRLAVMVSTGVTSTRVFSATQSSPWQLGWIDLGAWVSQNVTVTFAIEQGARDVPIQAFLDDITIGEWIELVVRTSSPAHIDYGLGGRLTISGENFIEMPGVKIGERLLESVRWFDETRLEVDLPFDLGAGRYDVVVINPAAQESVLPGALVIGEEVFLPLIGR